MSDDRSPKPTADWGVDASARTGRRRRPATGGLAGGLAAAVLVALAGGVLVGCNGSSSASPAPACGGSNPKLTVRGTGRASGTPDVLNLTLSVDTTGPSAQAALTADNLRTAAVIAALKAGGVAPKDIQTTGLSIQANYDTTGSITGYAVDNSVTAKLRDFSSAGSVIDAAAGAAGNAAVSTRSTSRSQILGRFRTGSPGRRAAGGQPCCLDGQRGRGTARAGLLAHRQFGAHRGHPVHIRCPRPGTSRRPARRRLRCPSSRAASRPVPR